ncbi:MAG: anti-sigma factor antagonist [Actinomycetota bacterium]|jgi:anti-anti-sigma regulatory factor|nr:anti-sigma factor antagonist [Actinomycetota bacterium]MDQ1495297.1 anti-sigma factor antagonist [Actinomycetota bacterium]
MSTMTADALGTVSANVLADGIVVRLTGSLDVASLPELRATLLTSRPEGCDDVLVDAGHVTEVHERALAVLVAAADWASETGGRLRFAAMSTALVDTADYFSVTDLLPRLPGPGGRADKAGLRQAR